MRNIHQTAQALLEIQSETYIAMTIRAGIRETKRTTTEIIKEHTLASYENLREGKMSLLD